MNPLSAPSVRLLLCLGVFTSGLASLITGVTAAERTGSAPVLMKAADRVPWTNLAELEAFAARGHLQACAQLGEQLLRGDGVAQNIPRALPLLEQAARGGVGSAIFRLGMVYEEGQGVTRDRLRALEYFRAAAAAGEPEGFFNVGAAYVGAHGVKRDYTEGLAWIILAAKRGAGGNTEQTVRDRILKLRRPEWIRAAEARAPVIEGELAAKPLADFLPTCAALVPPRAVAPAAPAPVVTAPVEKAPGPGKIQPATPALTLPIAPPPAFDLPPPPPKTAPPKP
jgi:TPR repeat protein